MATASKTAKPAKKKSASKKSTKTSATDTKETAKKASSKKAASRKTATAQKTTAKKAARKKTASAKTKTKPKVFTQTPAGNAALQKIDPEHRRRMIAETSYFIAERRGFVGGSPVDDWLEAEVLVDRLLETGEGEDGTSTLSSK